MGVVSVRSGGRVSREGGATVALVLRPVCCLHVLAEPRIRKNMSSESGSSSPELMGEGGCVAKALAVARVWHTEEEAKVALDVQIDGVLAARRRHMPSYERHDVGVDGSIWAADVVKRAVIAAGFHWQKLRLETDALAEAIRLQDTVILDGVLNNAYKDRKSGKTAFIAKSSPGCTPVDHEPVWRHCVAVVSEHVHDAAFTRAPIHADALWLADSSSTPDPERGYMRKIMKAYKITKCSGDACATCAARAAKKRKRKDLCPFSSGALSLI